MIRGAHLFATSYCDGNRNCSGKVSKTFSLHRTVSNASDKSKIMEKLHFVFESIIRVMILKKRPVVFILKFSRVTKICIRKYFNPVSFIGRVPC